MLQSESIAELLAALAEVQSELPTMPKSSQAYGYKYTDLDTITQTIKPILSKHGIGYMQSVGGLAENALTLTTRIFSKKGEYIEDTVALPTITSTKNNAAQTLGMSITYMRRYALCAMLGITSEEDVDANINGTTQTQGSDKPTPPKQEARPKKPAKLAFEPKGGETTAEEKKEIGNLLKSKYADGEPIYSKEEMKAYSDSRKDYTAREVIDNIKAELQKRLTPPAEPKQVEAPKPEEQKQPPVEGLKPASKIVPHCAAEQAAEMKKLFASAYPDGTPVMSEDEKEMYRAMGKNKSMQDTITSCKKYVADKLAQYKPQTAPKPEQVKPIPEEIF